MVALNQDDEFLVPSLVTVGGQTYDLGLKVDLARLIPRLVNQSPASPIVHTQDVIAHLFKVKDALSPPPDVAGEVPEKQSRRTWEKKFARIARELPILPTGSDPYLDYLKQFKGESGRHKRNEYDALNVLVKHAIRFFGMKRNPLDGLRPQADPPPIHTLTLSQVAILNRAPEDLTEKFALHMLLHHGWRPIEVRRITAGDIRAAENNIILCRGKGRRKSKIEPICILPESLALGYELTPGSLRDDQVILRSRRIRNGGSEPLGEDGLRDLTYRLLERARLEFKPYDLRKTFASLFREASKDRDLTERIMRHELPGSGQRYIEWPLDELSEALQRWSPLRLIQKMESRPPPSPPV